MLARYRRIERAFDGAFGQGANPLRHLGALGFLFFWMLALSGIYLYAVLDTSVQGGYHSIDRLSREQWYLGGLLRSIHRYSADAFVVVMMAHLAREWLAGHYRGFRRFSWLTGVPLILFVFVCAVVGFWLNWDMLGQFSAVATAELLDWLPFFASPATRNFVIAGAVTDRLFSLFVFVHLGVPLLLLFGLWFHIQRISRAAVFPPRNLAFGSAALLLALALSAPVTSHAPADVTVVPQELALDWILLFIHPLASVTSAGVVWILLGASLLLLLGLPFVPHPAAPAVAVVEPDHCSGCKRCFDDCPYAAIDMVPHADGRPGRLMARVDPDLCASCGICVGACPSSTPFRKSVELVSGINMPDAPIAALRRQMEQALIDSAAKRRLVVIGCDHGAKVDTLAGPGIVPLSLTCIGMLPPSFIEYALRGGAAGVLVSGCAELGCEFRLGQQWTRERLLGVREPRLRRSEPRHRIAVVWADAGDEPALRAALAVLNDRIGVLETNPHG